MDGKVGVESEPGHGSRFWIELKGANSQPYPQTPPQPDRALVIPKRLTLTKTLLLNDMLNLKGNSGGYDS
jgi:hypothetical protein